jgi:UDP-N-acetylmuramate dehydrogenase
LKIFENYSLKSLNTFGVDASCKYFVSIDNHQDLEQVIRTIRDEEYLILGGGSNILLTKDFPGLVIHNQIKGIEVEKEHSDSVVISVAGGEVWQDLVDFTLKHNWGGIENLSLIPGSVGAAPIQNIGAYGVELKNVFVSLDGVSESDNSILL